MKPLNEKEVRIMAELPDMSIDKLAAKSKVSSSTMRRFIRSKGITITNPNRWSSIASSTYYDTKMANESIAQIAGKLHNTETTCERIAISNLVE